MSSIEHQLKLSANVKNSTLGREARKEFYKYKRKK